MKGVAGAGRRFVITAGELRRAREDDRFVLALVTSALSSQPNLERLSAATLRSTFTFEPIPYWAIPIENDGRAVEASNRYEDSLRQGTATPASGFFQFFSAFSAPA